MAKVNDLKRAIAFDCIRYIVDKKNRYLVAVDDARCFSSLRIKFGQENRKGLGSVSVSFDIYVDSKMRTFTYQGWFDHCENDVDYRSLCIDTEFSASRLYSINNNKFEGLWLEEEEDGEAEDAPATASAEAEVDGKNEKSVRL